MSSFTWAFTMNNFYNCEQIRLVKWYNRFIGFPGETILAYCTTEFYDKENSRIFAKQWFEKMGHKPHVMGIPTE